MKLLQLNIYQGKFLDKIVNFVRLNDIDILNFQEVTGGAMSRGGESKYEGHEEFVQQPINKNAVNADCLKEITKQLNLDNHFLNIMSYKDEPNSYHGIATFYKKTIKNISSKNVYMKDPFEIEHNFLAWEKIGRGAIITKFESENKTFYTINTHLAWGHNPYDEKYKIEQAKILYDEISKLTSPFILSGDFNVIADTKTARMFEDLGVNLTKLNNITNTLNPEIHGAKNLFPKGLAVDFIFVSKDIKVNEFKLINHPNLSDHYALLLDFRPF